MKGEIIMMLNKYFDNYMDITTKEDKKYHIEKTQILVHGIPSFNGEANIYRKKGNIYIIKEVYSLEKNRLRYSYVKLSDVKAYDTIEKHEDGTETPILVVESFYDIKTLIGSIGNIKKIDSDKLNKTNDKPLILKLLRRNKNGEVDLESLLLA